MLHPAFSANANSSVKRTSIARGQPRINVAIAARGNARAASSSPFPAMICVHVAAVAGRTSWIIRCRIEATCACSGIAPIGNRSTHIATTAANNLKSDPTKMDNPMLHERQIEYLGVTKNLTQWSKQTGLPTGTIRKRLASGWSVAEALTTRVQHLGRNHKSSAVPRFVPFKLVQQHNERLTKELQRTMSKFMREFQRTANAAAHQATNDMPGVVADFSEMPEDRTHSSARDRA